MSDNSEDATPDQVDAANRDDDKTDAMHPSDLPLEDNEALSLGPAQSFGLSLLASAMLLAFLGIRTWLGTEGPHDSPTSIVCAALMALSVLVALPSWGISTVYALGSLVTVQRRFGLALLALLLNVASAIVFLLPK